MKSDFKELRASFILTVESQHGNYSDQMCRKYMIYKVQNNYKPAKTIMLQLRLPNALISNAVPLFTRKSRSIL